jgi:hypothetical protein
MHYCACYTPLPVHPGPRADSHRNSCYGYIQWVTRALYKLTKEPNFYITPDNQYQLPFVIEVG